MTPEMTLDCEVTWRPDERIGDWSDLFFGAVNVGAVFREASGLWTGITTTAPQDLGWAIRLADHATEAAARTILEATAAAYWYNPQPYVDEDDSDDAAARAVRIQTGAVT